MDLEQYIGRQVTVSEETKELQILGVYRTFQNYTLVEEDPTIKEIRAAHPYVRVWLPNTMGTMDLRNDRLNVHVGKDESGTWVIQNLQWG